ncbi:hypothetical protein SCG7109_BM_00030 [Chlamydiales bacterium SCGC AG-110-M15]|nr:hypothetical protein SCG7109_BM_00030 [Chlamydiales bacterium SCGC AG-110-M15]
MSIPIGGPSDRGGELSSINGPERKEQAEDRRSLDLDPFMEHGNRFIDKLKALPCFRVENEEGESIVDSDTMKEICAIAYSAQKCCTSNEIDIERAKRGIVALRELTKLIRTKCKNEEANQHVTTICQAYEELLKDSMHLEANRIIELAGDVGLTKEGADMLQRDMQTLLYNTEGMRILAEVCEIFDGNLDFHNGDHSLGVAERSANLAEGFPKPLRSLYFLAGAAHDCQMVYKPEEPGSDSYGRIKGMGSMQSEGRSFDRLMMRVEESQADLMAKLPGDLVKILPHEEQEVSLGVSDKIVLSNADKGDDVRAWHRNVEMGRHKLMQKEHIAILYHNIAATVPGWDVQNSTVKNGANAENLMGSIVASADLAAYKDLPWTGEAQGLFAELSTKHAHASQLITNLLNETDGLLVFEAGVDQIGILKGIYEFAKFAKAQISFGEGAINRTKEMHSQLQSKIANLETEIKKKSDLKDEAARLGNNVAAVQTLGEEIARLQSQVDLRNVHLSNFRQEFFMDTLGPDGEWQAKREGVDLMADLANSPAFVDVIKFMEAGKMHEKEDKELCEAYDTSDPKVQASFIAVANELNGMRGRRSSGGQFTHHQFENDFKPRMGLIRERFHLD